MHSWLAVESSVHSILIATNANEIYRLLILPACHDDRYSSDAPGARAIEHGIAVQGLSLPPPLRYFTFRPRRLGQRRQAPPHSRREHRRLSAITASGVAARFRPPRRRLPYYARRRFMQHIEAI